MSSVLTTTVNTTKKLTEEQIKRMEENRQKALQRQRQNKCTNDQNLANEPLKTASITTSTTNNPVGSVATSNSSAVSSNSGKCVYFDGDDGETRFEVIVGYNKALIDLFKTVHSRKYNPDTKRWNFSIKHYDDFINKVKLTIPGLKLEPLPDSGSSMPSTRFEAKFFLIDRCRFEVRCEYNHDLQELFKTMKTKRYDPIQKRWSFELKEYDELVNAIIKKFNRGVLIVPLPKIIREVFKEHMGGKIPAKIDPKIDLELLKTKLDPNISKNLLPFQIEGICFAVQQQGRLLLADDMGLGKTVQGLAIANFYKDEWPLIIVSPSSVKFMWKESVIRWLPNALKELCNVKHEELIENYIQVLENGRQPIDKQSKVVIASYDLLAKNINTISEVDFKVVICDECHLLKNGKAARTKAATRLTQNCKRIILLSGTPALSRPAELFTQIQAINPNLFTSFHDFGLRYCDGKESRFGWDYSGYSNMNELRILLEEKLLIRREKKDVMQQLPSKIREMVILNPNLVELNTKSLKIASNKMNENLKGLEKRGALLSYFQETSKAKVKAVCEYVNDLLESDKKFLVFAHHQSLLDEIENVCKENNYGYIRIDGSTGSEKRKTLVDTFQNSEKCLCAILSITAANSGITLTQASLVVFAELFWNPGILVQAEDRVYRIGQKNSVVIQYLCAKGTADDQMWPLVNEKLNVLSKAGLTRENLSEANTVNSNKFKDLFDENESQTSNTNDESKSCEKKLQKTAENKPIQSNTRGANQQAIDQLLNGIDLNNFDSPPTKKVKF